MIGLEPRIVFVFSGTNNFFAGGQSQEAFDDLLVAARILTEVGGHIAVVFNDTPRGDGNGEEHSNETEMNSTQRAHLLNYAQRIRRMSDMRNIIVVDSSPPLTTGTESKAIDTVFYDGLHNGLPGALRHWRPIRSSMPSCRRAISWCRPMATSTAPPTFPGC